MKKKKHKSSGCLPKGGAVWISTDRRERSLNKHQLKELEIRRMVAEWRQKKRAKKMGFGAPASARKPPRTVTCGWPVSGGAIETKKTHH